MNARILVFALIGALLGALLLAACGGCPPGVEPTRITAGTFLLSGEPFPDSIEIDPNYRIVIDEGRTTVTETFVEAGVEHQVEYRVTSITETSY